MPLSPPALRLSRPPSRCLLAVVAPLLALALSAGPAGAVACAPAIAAASLSLPSPPVAASPILLAGKANFGKGERSANEPPKRGSSAMLQGGSSADRLGGSSADHEGVLGPRDRHGAQSPRPFGKGGRRNSIARSDREEEERLDLEEQEASGRDYLGFQQSRESSEGRR